MYKIKHLRVCESVYKKNRCSFTEFQDIICLNIKDFNRNCRYIFDTELIKSGCG